MEPDNQKKPIPKDRHGRDLGPLRQWTQAHPLFTILSVFFVPFILAGTSSLIDGIVRTSTYSSSTLSNDPVKVSTLAPEKNDTPITLEQLQGIWAEDCYNASKPTMTIHGTKVIWTAIVDYKTAKAFQEAATAFADTNTPFLNVKNEPYSLIEILSNNITGIQNLGHSQFSIPLHGISENSIRSVYSSDEEAQLVAASVENGRWKLVCAQYVNTGQLQ